MATAAQPATRADVLFLQPPSPPYRNLLRDYAGGYGVSQESARSTWGHDAVTQPSLSLVYAFSRVREGFSAAFVDAEAERLDREALLQRVRRIAPGIIVSAVSLPSIAADLSVLATLKAATDAVVVAAGTVCRSIPEDVLAGGVVDIAVSGDIEVVAPELVRQLLAGARADGVAGTTVLHDGALVAESGGALDDLSVLPIPAFDLLPLGRYRTSEFGLRRRAAGKSWGGYPTYFPLYMSRGCPHGCSYCPYPLGFGRRWRAKPVEQVAEEFAAAASHGIRRSVMRDQAIAENPDYLERACTAIINGRSGIRWAAEARLGSLDIPLLRHMRDAGCVRIYYGVETGDEATFACAKRGVGFKYIAESLADTAKAGIQPATHFIIGFPGDNWLTIRHTVELIRELKIPYGDCSIMTPYPGTPFYNQMVEEGRILGDSWIHFTGADPVIRLDELSPVELSLGRWYVLQALLANKRPTIRRRLRAARDAMSSRSPGELRQLRRLIESAPVTMSTRGGHA